VSAYEVLGYVIAGSTAIGGGGYVMLASLFGAFGYGNRGFVLGLAGTLVVAAGVLSVLHGIGGVAA
jgi:hypothetical protein